MNTQPQLAVMMGALNQHRSAIVALEGIIKSIPDASKIDRETVKQKIKDSKLFGEQSPQFVSAAQDYAMRILG